MTKEKPKEGRGSAEIRAELDQMIRLRQKASADLENSKEARKRQREQKKALQVAAYQNDGKAVAKRDAVNKRLVELELEEADLADTVGELAAGIQRLEAEEKQAERAEAAERKIAREGEEETAIADAWAHIEVLKKKIIPRLWEIGFENARDAAKLGILVGDNKGFYPIFHLIVPLQQLVKMASSHNPIVLARDDYIEPLPKQLKDLQRGVRLVIDRELRRAENQTKKEVA